MPPPAGGMGIVEPVNPPAGAFVVQREAVFELVGPCFRLGDTPRIDLHPIAGRKLKLQTVKAKQQLGFVIDFCHFYIISGCDVKVKIRFLSAFPVKPALEFDAPQAVVIRPTPRRPDEAGEITAPADLGKALMGLQTRRAHSVGPDREEPCGCAGSKQRFQSEIVKLPLPCRLKRRFRDVGQPSVSTKPHRSTAERFSSRRRGR